ncbi:MAG: hypothetical protein CENE_01021 [Candidatus Celerinatantimonas neptuna]|nr:MAG: hypothetical protein CENE_01021 [Candidatus Celerinatantimonas neptuna]
MATRIARVEHLNNNNATLKEFFHKASALLNHWHERHRTRQQLSDMPEYLLRDIGLERSERDQELNKHFWQS